MTPEFKAGRLAGIRQARDMFIVGSVSHTLLDEVLTAVQQPDEFDDADPGDSSKYMDEILAADRGACCAGVLCDVCLVDVEVPVVRPQ